MMVAIGSLTAGAFGASENGVCAALFAGAESFGSSGWEGPFRTKHSSPRIGLGGEDSQIEGDVASEGNTCKLVQAALKVSCVEPTLSQ